MQCFVKFIDNFYNILLTDKPTNQGRKRNFLGGSTKSGENVKPASVCEVAADKYDDDTDDDTKCSNIDRYSHVKV